MNHELGRYLLALVVGVGLLAAGPALAAAGPDGVLPTGTLEELATYVATEMHAAQVPGLAYVVVQGDHVVDTRVFGVKKLGDSDLVDVHTVFEIGSASKSFTATMLAMVVAEGKLSWDDRVVDHVPSFKMYDPWVTKELRVADLLCQRSGMPAYSLDNMSVLGFSRLEIVHALRFVEPVTSFRSAYAYQNNLWLVAAALIEQKTGLSWEDNLDRRILGPLGMASSTTSPEVVATLPDVATGHYYEGATLVPIPADWPYREWLQVYGPAGSIHSTVLDLAQWLRLQLNLGVVDGARLLAATGVAYLQAPKTLSVGPGNPTEGGDFRSYSSGWVYETRGFHPLVWHNGGTTGMHSIIGLIPEAGVGIAMLTNEPDNRVPENALHRLADMVLGLPTTSVSSRAPGHAVSAPGRHLGVVPMGPSLPLERYVGTYSNPAYGPFEVRVRDGRLEMVFGPKRFVGVLQPFSGNTFQVEWPGWKAQVSKVTFTVPTGHAAEKMTVSSFEDVRGGEFVRVAGSALY